MENYRMFFIFRKINQLFMSLPFSENAGISYIPTGYASEVPIGRNDFSSYFTMVIFEKCIHNIDCWCIEY